MFRLKEEFRNKLNKKFLEEAEPMMNAIYAEGGKCYTNGIIECNDMVLPDFIYVLGSEQFIQLLDMLLTHYDKTDPDMQINSCSRIPSSRNLDELIEMYEEV